MFIIISSILQLFWIHQSNWTCIRWVFSWIYHNNLSHKLFTEFSKIQVEKIIIKITEKIFVIIIKLIILIVLQLIYNQNHMQLILIINQKLLVLKILNSQNLKQNLISKLKIILKILFFLLKMMRILLNCERKSTKNIL